MTGWLALLSCLILQTPQTPPSKLGPVPSPKPKAATPKELKEMSQRFRDMVIKFAPSPLYEGSPKWGHQELTRDRNSSRRDPKYVLQNHGVWRKIKVTADDLPQTLVFEVRRMESAEPRLVSIDLFLAFDTRTQVHQQSWSKGRKLIDGEIRARMRVKVAVTCDVQLETKATKYVIPEIIFRLKVRKADVDYENLVTEHIFGIGGDGAKLIGDVVVNVVKEFMPSLEKRLLDQLELSLVKALDNKEVKISVGKLFNKKK
jgi:hypothetical protein